MAITLSVTEPGARAGARSVRPDLILAALASAILLAGCGSQSELPEHQGIVVVRGASALPSSPQGQIQAADAGTAAFAFSDLGGTEVAEPLVPDVPAVEDAAQEAAVAAARDADPYRMEAVDPAALAEAEAAG